MREHCHRCRKPTAVCVCPGIRVSRIEPRSSSFSIPASGSIRWARRASRGSLVRARAHGRALRTQPIAFAARTAPSGHRARLSRARRARPEGRAPTERALVHRRNLGRGARSTGSTRSSPLFLRSGSSRRSRAAIEIRSEPAAWCVSTIEAIAEALAIVEPELEGLDRLVGAFESMIARQIEYRSERRPGSRRPARSGPVVPSRNSSAKDGASSSRMPKPAVESSSIWRRSIWPARPSSTR